ncbi:hypothetical protein [Sulfolobus acidocaldarius]|uniref:Uncharacterized protein n=4 Tax=Sulfolobus acidocaldarius TaxID=2285 RepID=Q4J903_SULAC|nr:hypothetical protein [Sulfolobus acidocaldarius]AHC51655.1 hypothetical protein SUSAZ_06680 [Sulfolobus acidocaldarius SUSAZ]AAY80727.1 hypothetical protein Saci_1397 [Sulfolobus acidocaldarius DSM 639]AGE71324.1 hypothetical protein SacN8_06800 [Sulfolobus acidocaldarius N8]AGE73593.1 hypothetical protein SacRon12I_06790 [Sulfolobus acidocaldarius Ron12/I]ALU30421.1 hypothetical protein ATY89_11025 [Sulfolobus acidocaldarius]
MKRAEILIVNNIINSAKIDENVVREILDKINDVDNIVINRITIPSYEENNNLLGVHVIVREVAET